MAFICFFFIFFQNKRFTVRLPDLSTSFTQLAVFTNPDEQKPSKSELCQTCTRAKREMHQHLAAMACTRMQSIKYCWKEGKYHQALQGEAFGFCSSPQSLCIILRKKQGYRYPHCVLTELEGHILQNNTEALRYQDSLLLIPQTKTVIFLS